MFLCPRLNIIRGEKIVEAFFLLVKKEWQKSILNFGRKLVGSRHTVV